MAIISCNKGSFDCPYLKFCLARIADPTIIGCSMPLWINGLIEYKDIQVQHAIKTKSEENKSDVTDEAVSAVAEYLLKKGEALEFDYRGRRYRLAVSKVESEE